MYLRYQWVFDKFVIAMSEFIGTAILTFLGCMGCVRSLASEEVPHAQMSFSFGFTILICVQVCAHLSGAHVNPALTLGAITLGHLHYYMFPLYFIAQMTGAIAGFALLRAVTPSALFFSNYQTDPVTHITTKVGTGLCVTAPHKDLHVLQALTVEIAITFILILVCCVVWDRRNLNKHDSISIRFGLLIAGIAMAAGPYTGGSMNPVRSFGPALINNEWDNHWIYWVGPLVGSLLAALLYRGVFEVAIPFRKPYEEGPDDLPPSRVLSNTDQTRSTRRR